MKDGHIESTNYADGTLLSCLVQDAAKVMLMEAVSRGLTGPTNWAAAAGDAYDYAEAVIRERDKRRQAAQAKDQDMLDYICNPVPQSGMGSGG